MYTVYCNIFKKCLKSLNIFYKYFLQCIVIWRGGSRGASCWRGTQRVIVVSGATEATEATEATCCATQSPVSSCPPNPLRYPLPPALRAIIQCECLDLALALPMLMFQTKSNSSGSSIGGSSNGGVNVNVNVSSNGNGNEIEIVGDSVEHLDT